MDEVSAPSKISISRFFDQLADVRDVANRAEDRSDTAIETSSTAVSSVSAVKDNLELLISTIQTDLTQNTENDKRQTQSILNVKRISDKVDISQERRLSKIENFLQNYIIPSIQNISASVRSINSNVGLVSQRLLDIENTNLKNLRDRKKINKKVEDRQQKAGIIGSMRTAMGGKPKGSSEGGMGGDRSSLLGGLAAAAGLIGTGIYDEVTEEGEETGTPGSGGKLLPIHKQALDIISRPESGGNYNAMNRGGAGDSPGGSKKWIGKNLTDMTIGEVISFQQQGKVYAAGRYQFVPIQLPTSMKYVGLSPEDKFDENNQDLMAAGLMQDRGAQPWTVGGSKYSAKELQIIEQARKTPFATSAASKPSGTPISATPSTTPAQQTSAAPSTTPAQQTSAAPSTTPAQQTSAAPSSQNNVAMMHSKDSEKDAAPMPPAPSVAAANITPSTKATSIDTIKPSTSGFSMVTLPPIASGGLPSGPAGGVSMTPDAIPILDTSNPSTMVWTVNAIKNLNISGSLESIYG